MIRTLQLLGLMVLLATPMVLDFKPLEILKLKTFDSFVITPSPSNYFTILNITEEDVSREGGYPLPRQRLADIHVELLNSGALGVGYVMAFSEPDRFGGDNEFSSVLALHPSVLSMFEYDNGNYPDTVGTVIMGEDIGGFEAKGVVENIPTSKNSATQGIASAPIDVDGLVRRIPLLMRTPDGWVASFGTQVLKVLANANTYVIKTNDNGIQEIRVKGLPPVPVDSLGRKWISWVDTPQTTLEEMKVEGTFVIVGVTASGVMPQIAVPNNKLLEPHKIQAALAESILVENSPYIPDYSKAVELLTLIISIALVWLLINYLGITTGIVSGGIIWGATAYGGVYLIQQGILIDVTWALLSQFITGSFAFYVNFRKQFKLRQQIKKQFGTYLSPDMVVMLQKNPELLKLGGERKEMTFLFSDIMGFTPVSEIFKNNDDPEGLVELINTYLDKMTKIILANGGTIDKYMGDCIMAFWNAPLPCENHAELAIKSAIEIEEATTELNKQFKEQGLDLPPINVGTGVNTGICIVGNMGSETRFDYSVVGDAVNLAARLEATAGRNDYKQWKIVLSEYTKELAEDKFNYEKIGDILVKGKSEPITIYFPAKSN